MIAHSDTHDTARGHKRAATPRSVVNTQWTVKRLILTLLWALTLSASTYALAWEATIERDALGVPHIFGKTDADMAYGLAWAQSEDGWEILEETLPY